MKGLASFASFVLAFAVAGAPAFAQGSLGSATAHIVLVQDCTDAGWAAGDVGTKCFESLSSLDDYIWGSSGLWPTATTPLTVDIGPGEFSGGILCPDSSTGFTTFRGAGRDRTVLKKSGGYLQFGVQVWGCQSLAFQDLSVVAESSSDLGYAVYWNGGGSSTWTDVNLTGDATGWYDYGCGGEATDTPDGRHNFFGSHLAGGKFGFYAECGESWFYGGEIDAFSSLLGSFHNNTAGVWVAYRGEVHLNGAAVRVNTSGISSGSGTAYGARVGPSGNSLSVPSGYGEFHSHGSLISVKTANLSGVAAVGVNVNDSSGAGDAKAHTHETAFVVSGGSSSTRLTGSGTFESPFQWEARTTPPAAGGAKNGQDTYVETDCDASGCSSGSDPHLMIYKSSCSPSPWFDTVRNACRN